MSHIEKGSEIKPNVQPIISERINLHLAQRDSVEKAQNCAPGIYSLAKSIVLGVFPLPDPVSITKRDPSISEYDNADMNEWYEELQERSHYKKINNVKVRGSIEVKTLDNQTLSIPVVLKISSKNQILRFILDIQHPAFDFVYLINEELLYKIAKARNSSRPSNSMDLEFGRNYDAGPKWEMPLKITPECNEVEELRAILLGFASSELQAVNIHK